MPESNHSKCENLVAQPAKRRKVQAGVFKRYQKLHRPNQVDEDARRVSVLQQWAAVIMSCPAASQVGREVLRSVGSKPSPEALPQCQEIIDDIVAMKSTATLVKRVGAIRRFVLWCAPQHSPPLPFREDLLHSYLQHLREQRAAASSGTTFLEAVRFAAAMFGIDGISGVSKRLVGLASKMAINSPALRQAPALLVDHVIALEQITAHSDVLQDQALAGSLLVLLYARCRFGDGQRATELLLDIAQDASGQTTGFIELSIRRHKTATSIERKRRILPVVAPIFSLSGIAWHDAWVRAREQLGLCAEGELSAPLCPAFDREGAPLPNGLTSGEGSELLRGLLRAHLGAEVPHYTSHSLKTTLLSCAAKFGLDLASRRILGYHLAPGAKTAETYARDCMAAPLRQLLGVLEAIRAGSFQPDVTRSGMFSVEESAEECLDQIDELSECCSRGSAEAPVDLDDDTELLKLLPAKARPKFLQAAAGKRIFRHKYLGLYHIQKEDGTALECGKLLTDNFVEVEARAETAVKCKGCYVASKSAVVAIE
ncbi:unnamed protein product [Durusdinium trenchii]|uniref:Tyr recombinase domain-containing protein n=1 Tax=Durusdinium trenchii TaxID=1381693 RepID=A0ABP0HH71_9DINO